MINNKILYTFFLAIGIGLHASCPVFGDNDKHSCSTTPVNKIYYEANPYCLCIQEGTLSIISNVKKDVEVVLIDNITGREDAVEVNLLESETVIMTNIPEGEYSVIINDNTEEIIVPTLSIE